MDANLTKTYVTDNLFYKVEYEISYYTPTTLLLKSVGHIIIWNLVTKNNHFREKRKHSVYLKQIKFK